LPVYRRITLRPQGLLGWLALVAGVALAIALAMLLFWVLVGLVAVGIVATPILLWWERRRLRRARRADGIIDAEYTFRE